MLPPPISIDHPIRNTYKPHYTNNQIAMKEQVHQLISLDSPPLEPLKEYHQIMTESNDNRESYDREYNSIQFDAGNLIDLGSPEQSNSSKIKLNNYMDFLTERVVELEKPELIKEGYLTSYKLYKIKSRKTSIQTYDTIVNRRFNDFEFLHHTLIENYGGYVLPRLPGKNFLANLNLETQEFQQIRTKELQKYLDKLINHSRIRFSNQLRHFLFDEQFNFSETKGEFIEQNTTIENIKYYTNSVYDFTKTIYQKFVGGKEKKVDFSRNLQDEQELKLFEREIEDLMKVTQEIKNIIGYSFQEFNIIHDFSIASNKAHMKTMGEEQKYLENYETLIEEFQEISSFVDNCYDAILRTRELRAQIEDLEDQQAAILTKVKQNPRNRDLDLLRNKLQKSNAKCDKWIASLKKELSIYTSEGKTMMQQFVRKYSKLRGQIYARC